MGDVKQLAREAAKEIMERLGSDKSPRVISQAQFQLLIAATFAPLEEEIERLRDRLGVYEKWKNDIENSGDKDGWATVFGQVEQIEQLQSAISAAQRRAETAESALEQCRNQAGENSWADLHLRCEAAERRAEKLEQVAAKLRQHANAGSSPGVHQMALDLLKIIDEP